MAGARRAAMLRLLGQQYVSFQFPQIDFLLRHCLLYAILIDLKQWLARLLLMMAFEKLAREPAVEALVVRALQLVALLADAVHGGRRC